MYVKNAQRNTHSHIAELKEINSAQASVGKPTGKIKGKRRLRNAHAAALSLKPEGSNLKMASHFALFLAHQSQ